MGLRSGPSIVRGVSTQLVRKLRMDRPTGRPWPLGAAWLPLEASTLQPESVSKFALPTAHFELSRLSSSRLSQTFSMAHSSAPSLLISFSRAFSWPLHDRQSLPNRDRPPRCRSLVSQV